MRSRLESTDLTISSSAAKMRFSALAFLYFTSSTLAVQFQIRQTSDAVFKVTDFTAFMADPYVDGAQSNLTFHVTDTRVDYFAEVDCVVPNTYFSLYAISALFDVCGSRELDFKYSYGEKGLTVRRGWRVNE